jgi:hypothetical protein
MLLRALLAFLALPGVVAIAVPAWFAAASLRAGGGLHPVGLLPLAAGFGLLLWCVRDFYVTGKGTLAPWSPRSTWSPPGRTATAATRCTSRWR